ncbi:uncharacterized protein Z518_06521 [Rhinocladiella mackenziei CBS 650.93]|uniref:Rhinocladiella mackenziei CBS 650.93 unplaced genomic scaffold supercont1.5, whole genome shotgun sequence n=1 Tax=Rhinocladiella mackenziei CBS 650.93 TaxID=1442369 RepID=A0A0D2II80_9EURO|nr:uncharacterized protein Z518_06521 [Rhinocladiella mackenziei CBS 650.93]KIX02971.1 hypothetical protein Z518_06521 [Rhinocladiella mackenziei CBS 650.93]
MYHVAAQHIAKLLGRTRENYKREHPHDHVFSDWEGPRENKSQYIGGHHLVHEYIGGDLAILKISFKGPSEYVGANRKEFQRAGYGTAICGRVGIWDDSTGNVLYTGHLIHLVKNEPDGCRMRSRFWLGDIEGVPVEMGDGAPHWPGAGFMKHCTEEMAILASKLPGLYQKHRKWLDRV